MAASNFFVESSRLSTIDPRSVVVGSPQNMDLAVGQLVSKCEDLSQYSRSKLHVVVKQPEMASELCRQIRQKLDYSTAVVNLVRAPSVVDVMLGKRIIDTITRESQEVWLLNGLVESKLSAPFQSSHSNGRRRNSNVVVISTGHLPISKLNNYFNPESKKAESLHLLMKSDKPTKQVVNEVKSLAVVEAGLSTTAINCLWRLLPVAIKIGEKGQTINNNSLFNAELRLTAAAIYKSTPQDGPSWLFKRTRWGEYNTEPLGSVIIHPVIAAIVRDEQNGRR